MAGSLRGLVVVGAVCAGLGLATEGAARPRLYDLNILLRQPHPFAAQAVSPERLTTPVPAMPVRRPVRVPEPSATPRYVQPAPAPAARRRISPASLAQARQGGEGPRGFGILSEARFGVLVHDEGPFSSNEEDGFVDVNLELLFLSPRFLDAIWSPRPHFGLTVNTAGDTSQAYFGLTWEWVFRRNWFAGFSLGGAVHDGELKTNRIDRKELGCRILFRESVEFGYRFAERHGVSLVLDHISNADICNKNEGLENVGVRYGYRF